MIFFDRTTAVVEKTLKDLARISLIITIVVQVFFILLYGNKIYINLDNLAYLIIYSSLAFVSLFGFIFYLISYKQRGQKTIKGTNRVVRIMKYVANGAMVVMILIDFANNKDSIGGWSLVLSGVTIFTFIVQIVIEVIRILYEQYSELFSIALRKDLEKFDLEKKFYGAVEKPFEAIAKKIKGEKEDPIKKKPSKAEETVDKLTEDYRSRQKEAKAEKKESLKERIKGHMKTIGSIFKKKEKEE